MTSKKWTLLSMALLLGLLILLGGATVIIDPYFHYHGPIEGLAYIMDVDRQRYINDGISKNFEYDALMTGTSMMENARASTFERLFDVTAIKVPYEGSSFKETDENLRRAIEANPDLRVVFRSLDFFIMVLDPEQSPYPEELYPRYLYDDKLYNDTNYIFNKTILLENTLPVLTRTLKGESMTSFDDYSLMSAELFGMGPPDQFAPPNTAPGSAPDFFLENTRTNVSLHVRKTIEENPQIEFYILIPPYSIIHWNDLRMRNLVDEQLDVEKEAASLLVDLENVHLFSFYDCPDIIGDLDDYMDSCHYGAEALDRMFEYMAKDEHRLTVENYEETFERAKKLFKEGDLAALLQ